jgi:pSer/pThr/pTyr-binding forkhead associated (FHA) protein
METATRATHDKRSIATAVRKEQRMTQTEDNQTFRGIITEDAVREAEWTIPAVLVVNRGPNAGFRFPLHQAFTTAGRDPRSGIFLDDVTVSRRHAEFRLDVPNGRSSTVAVSTAPTSTAS